MVLFKITKTVLLLSFLLAATTASAHSLRGKSQGFGNTATADDHAHTVTAEREHQSKSQENSLSISTKRSAQEVDLQQVGDGIDGSSLYGNTGSAVALSANGQILAVGSPGHYGYSGLVKVYQYFSGNWILLGQEINSESAGETSGTSISLSNDGLRIAIGGPGHSKSGRTRIYNFDASENDWQQVGDDIEGDENGSSSGFSVSLNANGSRVAVGSPDSSLLTGHAEIYELDDDNSWVQVGDTIYADDYYSALGYSIALNDDGNTVAIGSRFDREDNDYFVGAVGVYRLMDGEWKILGTEISGTSYYDLLGESIAISGDGNRIVVGVPNEGEDASGGARIYDYSEGNDWEQVGETISGVSSNDKAGASVSISSDGSRIVIGSERNDSGGADAGYSRIFDFDSNTNSWEQLGEDIIGDVAGDMSGSAVTISGNGSFIAIGAPMHMYYYGSVKVIEIVEETDPEDTATPSAEFSTAPSVENSMSPSSAPSTVPKDTATPSVEFSTAPSVESSMSPSSEPSAGSLCEDSPMTFVLNENRLRDCEWAASDFDRRCSKTGIAKHCPKTCKQPQFCDADSTKTLLFENDAGERHKCNWVAKKPEKRCNFVGVRETCRSTCSV